MATGFCALEGLDVRLEVFTAMKDISTLLINDCKRDEWWLT